MNRHVTLAITFVLFTLPLASADSKKDAGLDADFNRAEVEQLISQLSDKSYAVRQKAAKALQRQGPEALPLFREAVQKTNDPEVRRQVEELLPRLERMAALAPCVITLDLKDKPVREAVKALAEQSGYKIELSTPAQANDERERRLITVSLKKATFWEAMERICEQAGLAIQDGWYGPDYSTIRLDFGEMNNGVLSVHGPFRTRVVAAYYNRSLNINNVARAANDQPFQRHESLSVNLAVSVEPKLPLLGLSQPTVTEALDDVGQSLVPPPNPNSGYWHPSYHRSFMQQVSMNLTPSRVGRRIKLLKGVVPVTVVASTKPKIVVEKLMGVKNQTFKEGSTTITIDEVSKTAGNQISIKMSISENRNAPNDYTWMNSLTQRLEVVDQRGNKYQAYGHSWSGGNNSVQGTFQFGPQNPVPNPLGLFGLALPNQLKLVYNEWTTLVHPVPFEFKDLPLP